MSALLEKSTAPPGAFGADACVASLLPLPSSTDLSHLAYSFRDACALRAFPPLGAFFRYLFGLIPAMSHGILQEQPLMGRTGRCAAPSHSADLPAESAPPPSPQSFTLPSPRLLPEALADGKVREHREHCENSEPVVVCVSLPVCEGLCSNTSRGARPRAGTPSS